RQHHVELGAAPEVTARISSVTFGAPVRRHLRRAGEDGAHRRRLVLTRSDRGRVGRTLCGEHAGVEADVLQVGLHQVDPVVPALVLDQYRGERFAVLLADAVTIVVYPTGIGEELFGALGIERVQ